MEMGDVDALPSALLSVLAEPLRSGVLIEAVSAYHQDVSAAAYLQTLGLSTWPSRNHFTCVLGSISTQSKISAVR